jgi:uncharacterized membrane protein required for colicin V production
MFDWTLYVLGILLGLISGFGIATLMFRGHLASLNDVLVNLDAKYNALLNVIAEWQKKV